MTSGTSGTGAITLTILASFKGSNGANPLAGLTEDAAGDLFGTTLNGGAGWGTVFELAQGTSSIAVQVKFGGNGQYPFAGLTADAAGNLFGTTNYGGSSSDGTVFELSKGLVTTLANFTGGNGANPTAGLTADAAGNLYGTTYSGGSAGDGTVFDLAEGTSSVITLATFKGSNGANPTAGLIADAAGDLFGTTYQGGSANAGTLFELAKGTSSITTLVSFGGGMGANPRAGLIADAAGDLFGTTEAGGSAGDGTVFELAAGSSSITVLASFTGGNGNDPIGGLIEDAAGDLFGTTRAGGSAGDGTVFELARGSSSITTLVTFTGSNGSGPEGSLIADAAGDLFGTTDYGGSAGDGAVFEVTNAGFVLPAAPTITGGTATPTTMSEAPVAPFAGVTVGDSNNDATDTLTISIGDIGGTLSGAGLSGGAGGVYTITGTASAITGALDALVFTPKAGQSGTDSTTTFALSDLSSASTIAGTTSTFAVIDIDPALPTADLTANGTSDILLQSTDGTIAAWLMDGLSIAADDTVVNPGTFWHIATAGSFGGAGDADLVLAGDDGSLAVWEMTGPTITAGAVLANPGTNWHLEGTGNFNGPGLVLQADDGTVAEWNVNGDTLTGGVIIADPGSFWHVVGTGDFNGDGASGIVLQGNDGSVAIWEMNSGTISSAALVANPGTSWHVVATGDFNADGKSDIVLQNDNGAVAIWDMNGTTIAGASVVAAIPSDWHVVGTGDYGGAGTTDILLQDNTGDVAVWQMNANSLTGGGLVASVAASWQTIGQGTANFINGTNSAGTLVATPLNDEFIFTSALPGSHVISGFDPMNDMIQLSAARFTNLAGVLANTSTVSGAAVIALGAGATLTLSGVLPGQLTAHVFLFG